MTDTVKFTEALEILNELENMLINDNSHDCDHTPYVDLVNRVQDLLKPPILWEWKQYSLFPHIYNLCFHSRELFETMFEFNGTFLPKGECFFCLTEPYLITNVALLHEYHRANEHAYDALAEVFESAPKGCREIRLVSCLE